MIIRVLDVTVEASLPHAVARESTVTALRKRVMDACRFGGAGDGDLIRLATRATMLFLRARGIPENVNVSVVRERARDRLVGIHVSVKGGGA